MDDDYIDIQAHIYRAKKLRDEAAGAILAAGWQQSKDWIMTLLKRVQNSTPSRLRVQD
jgi:hypothetical protein